MAYTEANARLCFSPPDIEKILRPRSDCIFRAETVASYRSLIFLGSTPAFSKPKVISLSESILKNCDFGFWNTEPTCSAKRYISVWATFIPFTIVVPDKVPPSTKWGIRPLISFVMVVLPQPDSPVRTMHSPCWMFRSIWESVPCDFSYSKDTFWISIIGNTSLSYHNGNYAKSNAYCQTHKVLHAEFHFNHACLRSRIFNPPRNSGGG